MNSKIRDETLNPTSKFSLYAEAQVIIHRVAQSIMNPGLREMT